MRICGEGEIDVLLDVSRTSLGPWCARERRRVFPQYVLSGKPVSHSMVLYCAEANGTPVKTNQEHHSLTGFSCSCVEGRLDGKLVLDASLTAQTMLLAIDLRL